MLGERFHPSEEEMLLILRHKEEKIPISPKIIERDVYGKNAAPWIIFKEDDPWQALVETCGKPVKNTKCLYVITELKKKSKSKIERVAGEGTWSGQTGRKDVHSDRDGEVIGYKNTFKFKAKEGVETFGDWIMHEYRLDGSLLDGLPRSNNVICRIKRVYNSTATNFEYQQGKRKSSEEVVVEGETGARKRACTVLITTTEKENLNCCVEQEHEGMWGSGNGKVVPMTRSVHDLLNEVDRILNSEEDDQLGGGGVGVEDAGDIDWISLLDF